MKPAFKPPKVNEFFLLKSGSTMRYGWYDGTQFHTQLRDYPDTDQYTAKLSQGKSDFKDLIGRVRNSWLFRVKEEKISITKKDQVLRLTRKEKNELQDILL